MDDHFSLGLAAYEHVKALAEGIGPRPAGSEEERKALDYVSEQLVKWGYNPERKRIKFAPNPKFAPLPICMAILIILAGWGISAYPWLVIWTPLLVISFPYFTRLAVRARKKTADSEIVVALSDGDENQPVLYLCAHVDSGRAFPYENSFLRWLDLKSMDILQRTAIFISVVAVVDIIMTIPDALLTTAGIAGSAAGVIFAFLDISRQTVRTDRFSPGAIDNASGVGVVLAISEYIATHVPKRLRIGFLFTGAEETGLHGAQGFAEELQNSQQQAAVLNFDMVGAGDRLQYISREGTIFPVFTDRLLNKVLQEAYPDIEPYWFTVRSGDFAAFILHKIPAASLQTGGSDSIESLYHTVEDKAGKVEPRILEAAGKTALRFIELLPYSNVFRV